MPHLFHPSESKILPVPYLQQRRTGECLVACISMVCAYLGVHTHYRRLVHDLQVKANVGVSFANVYNLEKYNLIIRYGQRGTLAQLYRLLSNGWPIIVGVQTGELPYWNGLSTLHAVVVIGMDSDFVYLNDPEMPDQPRRVSIGDFDLAWLEHGERYVLIAPK